MVPKGTDGPPPKLTSVTVAPFAPCFLALLPAMTRWPWVPLHTLGAGVVFRPRRPPALACQPVPRVLLATDADWIHQEVDAALGGDDIDVLRVREGSEVRPVVRTDDIDLVVLDLQIGNMGGMAACMDLRLDQSVGLLDHVPVLMLLDRDVDAFLAKRSEADGWVVKPLDPFSLRRAATALLAGDEWKPEPTAGDHVVDEADDVEVEAGDVEAEVEAGDVTGEGAEVASEADDEATDTGADADESADPDAETS